MSPMARDLDRYRAKRDFQATSEPAGEAAEDVAADAPRFVVQQHDARRLHWDLRLEHDGVLASWALPRGVPEDPKRNHLAVRTEDHPLEYLEFHGVIPEGSYGAGTMEIFDRGTYETHKFRDDEVMVTFHGERVTGKYVLFRTRERDWMIHRMDPPVDPAAEALPDTIEPMLARSGPLPRDEARFGFEIKWDGVRAVAYSEPGTWRLLARSGRDITPRYPELRALGRALGAHRAVLDGEVVALAEDGRPSFERLQRRMHVADDRAVRRVASAVPVVYMIFDLLYLDGHSTLALAYEDRRALLDRLELRGASWQTPAFHRGEGTALLAASAGQGLEGIVAKRLDCPYDPGRRSTGWVKVKNVVRQSVVIGGWIPGQGRRSTTLGALAAGVYEDGELRYAGKVGTGFSEALLALLGERLAPLRRETSPFSGRQPPRGTVFVEPELVGEVGFTEWTRTGTLRHPSFQGLRDDLEPTDVVREDVSNATGA